ncbi:hypothetical protein TNCV_3569791 [Trichonephila clavipes]|nr:hypothetical protein TNCV_3569791 [Trichonephila clavipes]
MIRAIYIERAQRCPDKTVITRLQKNDPEEERLRIVEAAAAIIREDIRPSVVETKSYPPPSKMLIKENQERRKFKDEKGYARAYLPPSPPFSLHSTAKKVENGYSSRKGTRAIKGGEEKAEMKANTEQKAGGDQPETNHKKKEK